MTVFPEIFWSSHEIIFICKQKSVGLGGSRMGTKENKLKKWEDRVHGSASKKIETYCYSEIYIFSWNSD
jgi:hypothetical protein